MENRIVLQLIKKDIDELSMFVEALNPDGNADKALIDIMINKTQTLINEFGLLLPVESDNAGDVVGGNIAKSPAEVEESIEATDFSKKQSMRPIEVEAKPEIQYDIQHREECDKSILTENNPVEINKIEKEHEPVECYETTKPLIDSEYQPQQHEHKSENSEDLKISFNSKDSENKVLGETFVKELSLNERLAMGLKQEPKVKAQPISSLKGAIGLNDRFLFTRELFDGNSDNFELAIRKLDSSKNLMEAVEFLEENYSWSKTETSMKFIDLLKRRFA